MKLNYLGLLSGLSKYSATKLTITISSTLVMAETADAPDCTILLIRISLEMSLQAALIALSLKV